MTIYLCIDYKQDIYIILFDYVEINCIFYSD